MEISEQLSFLTYPPKDLKPELIDVPRRIEEYTNKNYSCHENEFLRRFINVYCNQTENDVSEPLPENVSAGKNSYVYDAHTYHTKVPPQAIEKLIEYYTKPGDLILDPFCGSGMTGVAAIEKGRVPILIDLSPASTFISHNFLTPIDSKKYKTTINDILKFLKNEELRLYGTHCRICNRVVPIEYMVWSYGLICNYCKNEFILWGVARDEKENVRESKIRKEFECPHCSKLIQKSRLKRTKPYPVQIGYKCCNSGQQESKAIPDNFDLQKTSHSNVIFNGIWYPNNSLPDGVNTKQAINHGFNTIDSLYTSRNLYAVAKLWDIARKWHEKEISLKLLYTITSLYQRVTRLSEFRFWGGSGNIANYNIPMIFNEQNVFKVFHRKAKTIQSFFSSVSQNQNAKFCISTQSSTDLSKIPDHSIDYVFTDPPFGGNINYSEMNYLWESWLDVYTDNNFEAIVSRVQNKSVYEYQKLMTAAFKEINRVLKKKGWLTLVFHNSSAKIWKSIQQAILDSGFSAIKAHTLDKRHGTFKQFVSENAVGYDIMLHCQPIKNKLILNSIEKQKSDWISFLKETLLKNTDDFILRYEHVNRKSEIDIRKLYSLWLTMTVENGELIEFDFEKFRNLIKDIIENDVEIQQKLVEKNKDAFQI